MTAKQLFANISTVCELFDCQVITDIMDDHIAPCPFVDGDGEECICNPKARPVYFLGERREMAAGLRGYSLTEPFNSMDDLNDFCTDHLDKFRDLSQYDDVDLYDTIKTWPRRSK